MKKFDPIFILVLSAFLLFSCSSKDNDEELADTAWNGSPQGDDSGDSLPDAATNDDNKTDTSSENDDSDTSDYDTSDSGITDNDITENADDPDTTPDSGDSQPDGDTSTPEPALPECSPSGAKPCILGKLIWSETKKTKLSQGGCNTQCTNLNEGGYSSGWRLPTINELRMLVQNCSKTVSLPEGVCQVSDDCIQTSCKTESDCKCSSGADYSKLGDTDSLWSGTKVESNMSAAWYINFSNAYIDSTNTSDKKSARCVHEIK